MAEPPDRKDYISDDDYYTDYYNYNNFLSGKNPTDNNTPTGCLGAIIGIAAFSAPASGLGYMLYQYFVK